MFIIYIKLLFKTNIIVIKTSVIEAIIFTIGHFVETSKLYHKYIKNVYGRSVFTTFQILLLMRLAGITIRNVFH